MMKRFLLVMTVGMCSVFLFAQAKKTREPTIVFNQDFADGEELFRLNKPDQAIPLFEKIIDDRTVNPAAFVYLGVAYYQVGEYQKSLNVCVKGLARADTDHRVLAYNAGNAAYAMGNYARADACYAIAIQEAPDFSAAYLNRANAQLKQDHLADAKENYRTFIEKEPEDEQRPQIEQLLALLDAELVRRENEKPELITPETLHVANELMQMPVDAEKVVLDDLAGAEPEPLPVAPASQTFTGEKVSGLLPQVALAPETAEPPKKIDAERGLSEKVTNDDDEALFAEEARLSAQATLLKLQEEAERLRTEAAERARVEEENRKALEAERAKMEEERRALEAERAQLAEEKRKAEEAERAEDRRALEAEWARLEEERRAMETERAKMEEEKRLAEMEARERQFEEEKRKAVEAERARLEAENRKVLEAERAKLEEERRKSEAAERERQFEEEKRKVIEAERAKLEEERRRAEEAERALMIQEEMRKAVEAERARVEEEQRKAEEAKAREEARVAAEKEAARLAELATWPKPAASLTADDTVNFTPDGDGHHDTVTFTPGVQHLEEPPEGWTLSITDPHGNPFRTMTGTGALPDHITWDGTSDSGEVVLSKNTYTARLSVRLRAKDRERTNMTAAETTLAINTGLLLEVIVPGHEWKMVVNSINFVPNGALNENQLTTEQKAANYQTLDEIAAQIKDHPGAKVVIVEGYANNISGTEKENREELVPLSTMRAQAIVEELVKRGVDPRLLSADGKGGANPMASQEDHENWWKNRRVEFRIQQ